MSNLPSLVIFHTIYVTILASIWNKKWNGKHFFLPFKATNGVV